MRAWLIKGDDGLFWSVTLGWGGYLQATMFTDEEKILATIPTTGNPYWELDWEVEAPMMTWNHRVVRTQDGNDPDNPVLLRLVEVYYGGAGELLGYSEPFMCGDDIGELRHLVARLTEALEQPIIDESSFPAPTTFEGLKPV